MTKATDTYELVRSRIATLLPNHQRLINPYIVESNDDGLLAQGWGLRIGTLRNRREETCFMRVTRQLSVVITRELVSVDHDRETFETLEKQLTEDMAIIAKDSEFNVTLGSSANVENFEFISDGGIDVVSMNKTDFYLIEGIFELTYFEAS